MTLLEQKNWGKGPWGQPEADLSEIHPCVALVQAISSRELRVWWSYPVDDSVLDPANYVLAGPGNPLILEVQRLGPQSCVLTTTELARDERYVLEALNVQGA